MQHYNVYSIILLWQPSSCIDSLIFIYRYKVFVTNYYGLLFLKNK